jgi:hypothetical protein
MGGETAEVMCEVLAFEADRRAFIITINSFGTELTKVIDLTNNPSPEIQGVS